MARQKSNDQKPENFKADVAGIATLLLMVYALTSVPAFAYLDPGSGSYFVQLLIAGMAGGAYLAKQYSARIATFFKSVLGKKKHEK